MSKDYYSILGVEKSATESEIKLAFRRQAKSLHPDVNSSHQANAEFQDLNEAYIILGNAASRLRYDNGELEEPEVTYTWEEVEQILREREIRRQNRGWDRVFTYDNENVYPPTNYEANERTVQLINLGILIFAFSFILDFFIFFNVGSEIILNQNVLVKTVRNGPSQAWTESNTESLTFYIAYGKPTPKVGDEIEVKRSLFYGNHKFKTQTSDQFIRADDLPMVIYIIAALACLIGWLGTSKYFNAERKFNAAIIGVFLSITMIVILFYPR